MMPSITGIIGTNEKFGETRALQGKTGSFPRKLFKIKVQSVICNCLFEHYKSDDAFGNFRHSFTLAGQ